MCKCGFQALLKSLFKKYKALDATLKPEFCLFFNIL